MSFNITEPHNQLIKNSSAYVANLEATAFDRRDGNYSLTEDINELIDSFLMETGREYELFIGEVPLLSVIEINGDSLDAIQSDNDLCYIVCCDSGLNIIGSKISLSLEWDEIQYLMIHNNGDFTFMLYDGVEVYVLNKYLSEIFKELFLKAKQDKSFNIKVMQEI